MYDSNSPSQWYHLADFWLVYHGLHVLVANGEHHNLCHPRHTICLQLNPIAYVHPDIKSYPSVKCLLLLPLLLPLPFAPSRLPLPVAPLPISPFKLPPLHLPLPIAPSRLPLSFPLLALASSSPPSPPPPHCPPPHLPISVSPVSPSQSPPPHCPLPVSLPSLLPVHPSLDHYLHLNQDMLQLLLSFCSFAHLR